MINHKDFQYINIFIQCVIMFITIIVLRCDIMFCSFSFFSRQVFCLQGSLLLAALQTLQEEAQFPGQMFPLSQN